MGAANTRQKVILKSDTLMKHRHVGLQELIPDNAIGN
jgi:hypothetical protein